jgi:hypothetical protein
MSIFHIVAETDQEADRIATEASEAIRAAGGTIGVSHGFDVQKSVVVAQLPEGVTLEQVGLGGQLATPFVDGIQNEAAAHAGDKPNDNL